MLLRNGRQTEWARYIIEKVASGLLILGSAIYPTLQSCIDNALMLDWTRGLVELGRSVSGGVPVTMVATFVGLTLFSTASWAAWAVFKLGSRWLLLRVLL